MKLFLYLLVFTFSIIKGYDKVPFDWAGQFGLYDYNGKILWNSDWRSNGLLFDGTWIIYPTMLGMHIEEGFDKNTEKIMQSKNSTQTKSYFQYDQGDYLLDRFLFGISQKSNKRSINMSGFKRSYVGNYNQYNNSSLQPAQQSYLFSYHSNTNKDLSRFSFGHFNTLSGFPDIEQNGLYKNKITSYNFYWKRSIGKMNTIFSVDNFLQKYNAKHILSSFDGARFLTRGLYKGKVELFLNKDKIASVLILSNIRSINVDTVYNLRWNEVKFSYEDLWSNISLGFLQHENDLLNNFDLSIKKKVGMLNTAFAYKLKNQNIHPYFLINQINNLPSITLVESMSSSFGIIKKNIKIESSLFYLKDDEKFWEKVFPDSTDYSLVHKAMQINLETSILKNYNLNLAYKVQNPSALYSSGFGRIFSLNIGGVFSLFDDYMKLGLNGYYKNLTDINHDFFIDPIEMVPKHNTDYNNWNKSINIINASIVANVSKFSISFEWYNINEIFQGAISSSKNNQIFIYPGIPELGSQINLLVGWKFLD